MFHHPRKSSESKECAFPLWEYREKETFSRLFQGDRYLLLSEKDTEFFQYG
ncbi:hypothetical protein [Calothrix sp. CCY 0018]|uniref:hypothetical protein n=1 Tax=Calothrix sp. CCY 0018 TaxID=3103864 RepID=UPI0039C66948